MENKYLLLSNTGIFHAYLLFIDKINTFLYIDKINIY